MTEIEICRESIKEYRKSYGQNQLSTDCIIQLMIGHKQKQSILSEVGITFKEKIEKEIRELEIKHNMTHQKNGLDENELLLGLIKYWLNVDVDDKNQP